MKDLSIKEVVIGFFEANKDKAAVRYNTDLQQLIPVTSMQVPLMSDNCPTMVKLNKIQTTFRKTNCGSHRLATMDKKSIVFQISKI